MLGEFTPVPCLFGTFVARQKYTPSGAKNPEGAGRRNSKAKDRNTGLLGEFTP
ncbi:MAG: hypothetical protein KDC42_00730 [Ignavibacteriae bacterium]|nr:hypothetical protein [Ignavibacteriota bacterium]